MLRATRRRILVPLALLFGLLGLLGGPRYAWAAIKLYMKDGTFQLVKSYVVRGDRVRYYSLERSEWEEVPKSLVDFEATERAQKEEKTEQQKELQEVRELEKQRFDEPAATGFEVAPGIRLPTEEGVFAFDGVRVIRMVQSSAEVVTDRKRLALIMALPGPLVKSRSLVVLPGPKAAIRISNPQPTFYVQSEERWGQKAELIPVKSGKESRVVEKVQGGIGVGKSGELRTALPLERAEISPGLFQLKPVQSLTPGEYALGELVQEKLNLELWDFGIEGRSRPEKNSRNPD